MNTVIKDIRASGKKKWLLLLPFLFMIVLYVSIQIGENTMENLLLREKYVAIHNMVDAISASVDVESDVPVEGLLAHSLASVACIDELPYVYAAAFTEFNGDLVLLSERDNATNFDPLDYDAFMDATSNNPAGELTIGFTPDGLPYRELLMYYKWMPTELPYLIVIGVSTYSVTTKVPVVMNMSLWLMLFITFVTTAWMIYVVIRQSMRTAKIQKAYTAFINKEGG